jgi:LysR family transcriptional regulator, glycine cleavage system transcriptional activator
MPSKKSATDGQFAQRVTAITLGRFPLDTLPGFIAAARSLSFTQAAIDLQLTQSAVSKQIKALEEAVGLSLFKRGQSSGIHSGGRLELTEAGRQLLVCAIQSVNALDETLDRIRRTSQNTISITTTPSFASLWLVPKLAALKTALKRCDVLLDAQDDVVNLEAAGIDMAIRLTTKPISSSVDGTEQSTHIVPLVSERVVVVCSPSLLSGVALPCALGEISKHTLLAFDDSHMRFPLVSLAQWLNQLGVLNTEKILPKNVVRFTHYEQVIRAAVSGSGFAVGRRPLVDTYLASGELIEPFKHLSGSTQEVQARYQLVITKAAMAKPATTAFVTWIKDALL